MFCLLKPLVVSAIPYATPEPDVLSQTTQVLLLYDDVSPPSQTVPASAKIGVMPRTPTSDSSDRSPRILDTLRPYIVVPFIGIVVKTNMLTSTSPPRFPYGTYRFNIKAVTGVRDSIPKQFFTRFDI